MRQTCSLEAPRRAPGVPGPTRGPRGHHVRRRQPPRGAAVVHLAGGGCVRFVPPRLGHVAERGARPADLAGLRYGPVLARAGRIARHAPGPAAPHRLMGPRPPGGPNGRPGGLITPVAPRLRMGSPGSRFDFVKAFTSPAIQPARGDPATSPQGAEGPRTEVDVLVVGAGPAGAAAAYHLARHGVDVLAVDKAAFPREKVCGDGLTPRGVRAIQDMGVDPTAPGFVRIDGLRVHGPTVELNLPWPALESMPDFGVVRTRHDLDHLLVQRAQKAGALVWEGTEIEGPLVKDGWVVGARIRGEDGSSAHVRARYVVACDGAASRFAGKAGATRDPGRSIGTSSRGSTSGRRG